MCSRTALTRIYLTTHTQVMLHAPLLRSFYLGEGHDPGNCRLTARDKPCLSCQMVSERHTHRHTDICREVQMDVQG